MGGRRGPALDSVEGGMKDFKLSEAEKSSVKMGRRYARASMVNELQAVGMLFLERSAKVEYVGRTLGNLRCPLTALECKDLGRSHFLFTFHDESNKNRFLFTR
jgi:hypothetical protein